MARYLYRKDDAERIHHWRKLGVTHIQFLGARNGEECAVCLAFDGMIFPIDSAPLLPPPGCRCKPYSAGIWITMPIP